MLRPGSGDKPTSYPGITISGFAETLSACSRWSHSGGTPEHGFPPGCAPGASCHFISGIFACGGGRYDLTQECTMGTRKERTKQGTFGFVEPGSVSPDGRTLEHGFPPGIAMTAPAPGAGEEAEGRAGWGLQESLMMWRQGRGRPPPRQPHPREVISPRSTAWGHARGKRSSRGQADPGTNLIVVGMKTRNGSNRALC